MSYRTVCRYVNARRRTAPTTGTLELEWHAGEAQVDFGQADVRENAQVTRVHFLCLTFPYSNAGYLQLFRGENAECVAQGLVNIFHHLGGAPRRLVFDNASGVGRRIGDTVRMTELFSRCQAHYGFETTFCNPYAGHEKGNVENKVGYFRRNLLVPIPVVSDLPAFNRTLLGRSERHWERRHYKKGVPVMLIGNPAAEDLLADEFRQARRMSDVGDIVWDPIPKPPNARVHGNPAPLSEWDYFLQGLWRYQYTRHPLAWDSDEGQAVRSALYEATQGITHFVTRLWIVSQERAMDSGHERLSDTIVLSTAEDSFRLAKKVLRAIARRDWQALKSFDDVYYEALERLWTTPVDAPTPESDIANWLIAGGFTNEAAKAAAKQALNEAEPEADETTIRRTAYHLADTTTDSKASTIMELSASTTRDNGPENATASEQPNPEVLDLDDSLAPPDEWNHGI